MTIIQIKYFLEAADCGNFQRASEKLYISHQALSKQIKSIEKELDVELFDKSEKRNLRLTSEGKILYKVWKEAVARHDEAIAIINRLRNSGRTSLKIGIQDMPKIRLDSIAAFSKYKAMNPDSTFEYKIGTPEEIMLLIDSNKLDMAIMFSPSVESPDKYRHIIINEHPENPVIAISVDNPLSSRQSPSIKELENETFIMIDAAYSRDIVNRQRRDFIANQVAPEKVKIKTVPDPNELVMALVLNQGVSIIHKILLDEVKDKVKTFPCKIAEENVTIGTIFIWNDHKYDHIVKSISTLFNC